MKRVWVDVLKKHSYAGHKYAPGDTYQIQLEHLVPFQRMGLVSERDEKGAANDIGSQPRRRSRHYRRRDIQAEDSE
jgi:hypothetical protein